jgi:hypothetical protein
VDKFQSPSISCRLSKFYIQGACVKDRNNQISLNRCVSPTVCKSNKRQPIVAYGEMIGPCWGIGSILCSVCSVKDLTCSEAKSNDQSTCSSVFSQGQPCPMLRHTCLSSLIDKGVGLNVLAFLSRKYCRHEKGWWFACVCVGGGGGGVLRTLASKKGTCLLTSANMTEPDVRMPSASRS